MARRFGNLQDEFDTENDENNVVESDYNNPSPEVNADDNIANLSNLFKSSSPENEEQRIDNEIEEANAPDPVEDLQQQVDNRPEPSADLHNLLQNYRQLRQAPAMEDSQESSQEVSQKQQRNAIDHRANILEQYNRLMNRDNILKAQQDQASGKMNAGMLLGAGQLAQAFGTRYGAKIGDNSEGARMVEKNADLPVQQIAEGQKLVGQQLDTLNATEMHDPTSQASGLMRGMAYKMLDKLDPENKLKLQGQLEDMSAMQMGKLPGMKSLFDNIFKQKSMQQIRDYVGKNEKGETVHLSYDPITGTPIISGTNIPYKGELFYKTPKKTPEDTFAMLGLGGSSKTLYAPPNYGKNTEQLNTEYKDSGAKFKLSKPGAKAWSDFTKVVEKDPGYKDMTSKLRLFNEAEEALKVNNRYTLPQITDLFVRIHTGKSATDANVKLFKEANPWVDNMMKWLNTQLDESGGVLTENMINEIKRTARASQDSVRQEYKEYLQDKITQEAPLLTQAGVPTEYAMDQFLNKRQSLKKEGFLPNKKEIKLNSGEKIMLDKKSGKKVIVDKENNPIRWAE
jgi:carbonic anhydrase